MIENAAVLGAGSWGTALAIALADRKLNVVLYGNDEEVRDEINTSHSNKRYLPDVELPENIIGSTDINETARCEVILLVVPSQVARIVLKQLAEAQPSK